MRIDMSLSGAIDSDEVIGLYRANGWSSADKPEQLMAGLGNAISDGHLVVCFPHKLVDPAHQGTGVGRKTMQALLGR